MSEALKKEEKGVTANSTHINELTNPSKSFSNKLCNLPSLKLSGDEKKKVVPFSVENNIQSNPKNNVKVEAKVEESGNKKGRKPKNQIKEKRKSKKKKDAQQNQSTDTIEQILKSNKSADEDRSSSLINNSNDQSIDHFGDEDFDYSGTESLNTISRKEIEKVYKTGRWQPDEHQRFIEAIFKYGNEWKKVQKHVGSRSSTQARSHAQKFFVKIKRTNLLDLDIDLSKSSIKSLQEVANQMNTDQYLTAIKKLNNIAFEKKSFSNMFPKRRKFSTISNPNLPDFAMTNINSSYSYSENNANINESLSQNANKNDSIVLDPIININNHSSPTKSRPSPKIKRIKKIDNNKDKNHFVPLNQNINTTTNNFNFKITNQKNFNLPNNIKILSMKEEDKDHAFNNSFYNVGNNDNKNIIINNNINNYNISLHPSHSIFQSAFSHKKRPRMDSFDNIFSNENHMGLHSNMHKIEIEDDFHASLLDSFKNERNDAPLGDTERENNNAYNLNIDNFFVDINVVPKNINSNSVNISNSFILNGFNREDFKFNLDK